MSSYSGSPSRSSYVAHASLEQSLIDEELAAAEADGVIVGALSFEPPMSCTTVRNQEGQRMDELRELRDSFEAALAWEPSNPVDARFDEATIQDQIDDLLPPVMEDEEDIKAAGTPSHTHTHTRTHTPTTPQKNHNGRILSNQNQFQPFSTISVKPTHEKFSPSSFLSSPSMMMMVADMCGLV